MNRFITVLIFPHHIEFDQFNQWPKKTLDSGAIVSNKIIFIRTGERRDFAKANQKYSQWPTSILELQLWPIKSIN